MKIRFTINKQTYLIDKVISIETPNISYVICDKDNLCDTCKQYDNINGCGENLVPVIKNDT